MSQSLDAVLFILAIYWPFLAAALLGGAFVGWLASARTRYRLTVVDRNKEGGA